MSLLLGIGVSKYSYQKIFASKNSKLTNSKVEQLRENFQKGQKS